MVLSEAGSTAPAAPAPRLESSVDPGSAAYRANTEAHRALVAELRGKLGAAALGGGEKARARHTARGKLLPRDRVDTLLDPGSPFLELAPLAADGLYDGAAPAAGVIAGIGRVAGREVMVVANDATVKGGTYYPMTVKKHLRAQDVALRTGCPASTWSTPAAPSSRCRTRSSRTATTSAGSSTTRRGSPVPGSRRSRRCSARARRAARTSRR
ncbi:hypothetical protein GCM10023235_28010 [Kitasatospora terrestris]|uniref:CoA carboxyltransferase N-terminal domain-containing protein n=1 Tax=Kitasatospora terrestris TaxID=258051 RepID=A0ABP9DJS2_9ACTN